MTDTSSGEEVAENPSHQFHSRAGNRNFGVDRRDAIEGDKRRPLLETQCLFWAFHKR